MPSSTTSKDAPSPHIVDLARAFKKSPEPSSTPNGEGWLSDLVDHYEARTERAKTGANFQKPARSVKTSRTAGAITIAKRAERLALFIIVKSGYALISLAGRYGWRFAVIIGRSLVFAGGWTGKNALSIGQLWLLVFRANYRQLRTERSALPAAVTGLKAAMLPMAKEIPAPPPLRPQIPAMRFGFTRAWQPALKFGFVMVAIALGLRLAALVPGLGFEGLAGRVLGVSGAAIGEFMSGSTAAIEFDLGTAHDRFQNARTEFSAAGIEAGKINDALYFLARLAPDAKWRLAGRTKDLLQAGENAALIGQELTLFASAWRQAGRGGDIREIYYAAGQHLWSAATAARSIDDTLDTITPQDVPEEHRERFVAMKGQAEMLVGSLAEIDRLYRLGESALGFLGRRRYLVVFENNAELRAGGGFIGSFALLTVKDGIIESLAAPGGGSYDTEGGMRRRIAAPEPLRLLNPLWHFWDANWWPDWPKTARKLAWFYEKSDGPTVDGVIGITPNVAEGLLELIGPIDLPAYGLTISRDNFWLETQRLSERKPDVTDRPKEIIADLLDAIRKEAPARLTPDKLPAAAALLERSFTEKHLAIYLSDPDLQATISAQGWGAEQARARWDYLMAVHTNIGGAKSDRRIANSLYHRAEIGVDGTIVDTVTIVRQHLAAKNEEFTGVRANDWFRLYVPAGSTLLAATGFTPVVIGDPGLPEGAYENDPDLAAEAAAAVHGPSGTKIYGEDDKTVFANWLVLEPGQTATATIRYRLPWRIAPQTGADGQATVPAAYALAVDKQIGTPPARFETALTLAPGWQGVWRYPSGAAINDSGWSISTTLDSDRFWATMVRPRVPQDVNE